MLIYIYNHFEKYSSKYHNYNNEKIFYSLTTTTIPVFATNTFHQKHNCCNPVLNDLLHHLLPKPRARDIGIPFDGTPGKFNAITDVKGVEVGFSTIISGQGKNVPGKGPVRTGVTAILPRGRNNNPVYSNLNTLNGNGDTALSFADESAIIVFNLTNRNNNRILFLPSNPAGAGY